MAQAIAGASTAGPMFFLGFQSLRVGDVQFGVLMLICGGIVFFMPGLIMQRLLGRMIAFKDKCINGVKHHLSQLTPRIPFRD